MLNYTIGKFAKKVFKFLSSVKLAVPLMLILALSVGIGTVIESRYNADYARLLIYQTWWFYVLLTLLWINIFCAAASRWPFKPHHTGFVITHIGLLTLLIGAFVTAKYGIDGQLTISEEQKSNSVVLSDSVIEFANLTTGQTKIINLPRWSSKKNLNLEIGNRLFLTEYLPFTKTEDTYQKSTEGRAALKFSLKSPFFNVTQWLHEEDNPEIQMGPALFKIKRDLVKKLKSQSAMNAPLLIIFDAKTSKILAQKTLMELKKSPFNVGKVKVSLLSAFKNATVEKNRIAEGSAGGVNPAIELSISSEGKKYREISYANFPDFSLNAEPPFNLKFHYVFPVQETQSPAGNIVEFDPGPPLTIKLSKNKKEVAKKVLKVGEVYETPWMGIQITVLESFDHSLKKTLTEAIEPPQRAPLPPPAVKFSFKFADSDETLWLSYNQSQDFKLEGQNYSLFYGAKVLPMPFTLKLDKFEKVDYPGTETPKSFKSTVTSDSLEGPVVISMNEPLKHSGYTLYQASYIMQEGMAPASVFSVNHDPGRWIKYIGSIILAIGIITFTFMRSSLYKKWKGKIK